MGVFGLAVVIALGRKGEPMSDLIDRQVAIEAINHICPVDTEYDCTLLDRVDVRCVLSDLPSAQAEQRWIPVSERLPEVGQYVLCYLKGWHYLGKYRVCKYRDADKYVNHPYFDFNENGFPDVLAWMPLPEPYKAESEE